jgi:hypothetical protein
MPLPYPDNLTPDEGDVVIVVINEYWWSVLFGFADAALERRFWSVTDEQFDSEIRPAVLTMLGISSSTPEESVFITDIRLEGEMFQYFKEGQWHDIGLQDDFTADAETLPPGSDATAEFEGGVLTIGVPEGETGATGPTGGTGPTGATGPAGNIETIIYTPELNPDSASDAERRCNAATGLMTWLFEKFNDTIDIVEATADTIGALDAITAAFPPAYLVIDSVTDAFNEIVESTVALCRAYDTVSQREEETQEIYCFFDASGDLTEAAFTAYIDSLSDFHSPGQSAFKQFLRSISAAGAVARARIESYGDDAVCSGFECDEQWCWTFDLTADDFDFVAADGYSNPWSSGNGFQGQLGMSNPDRNFLKLEFTETRIISFQFDISANDSDQINAWICPGETDVICSAEWLDTNLLFFNKSIVADIDSIAFGVERSSLEPFIGYITRVTIVGEGTNPFGEGSNCS